MDLLRSRYHCLRTALARLSEPFLPYPFNAGCFALLGLDPRIPVEPLRLRLIDELDTGVIAIGAGNAIRLAYCSLAEDDVDELVDRLDRAVR